MKFKSSYQSYASTGFFSKLVVDYIQGDEQLHNFYAYTPNLDGIQQSIANKKQSNTNRALLCDVLTKQYEGISVSEKLSNNIRLLQQENTFTICTAHQPNIFTGHLYFIYKIIHAIKLADELNAKITDAHFVPVYYMGSEDADLSELGEIYIDGKTYKWETNQQGAVGRMLIDKAFISLLEKLAGRLVVEPFGQAIVDLVQSIYTLGKTIELATFELVHQLFDAYGLVVLLPDNPRFKHSFASIIKDELLSQQSFKILSNTIDKFPKSYNIQTSGRPINLFYLNGTVRERIEQREDCFHVVNTNIQFTATEIMAELNLHPERFSPNVVLRPLYQELILPNVVFIGGGGELAYWLELKAIFDHYEIQFPVMLLRNSYAIMMPEISRLMEKLSLTPADFFLSEDALVKKYITAHSEVPLQISAEITSLLALYNQIKGIVQQTDVTLVQHTAALHKAAEKKLLALEKKMMRAAKRKASASIRQIQKIKSSLFPEGTLQERKENFLFIYAQLGPDVIAQLYQQALTLEQKFTHLEVVT